MADQLLDTSDIEKSIAKYSRLSSILIVITIVIAIACLYFGVILTTLFLWGLLTVIPLVAVITSISITR